MTTVKNEFSSWEDSKKEIKSLSEVEKEAISQTAKIVNKMVFKRSQLRLTQQQVADKAGLTQSQVAKVETGCSVPTMNTLIKMAFALDMKVHVI